MQILAIDPGIRGCGVACFAGSGADARLYGAAYIESPVRTGALDCAACVAMARAVVAYCAWSTPGGFQQVVCEWPQVYTGGKMKGDPNDLPPLAGVDCAICALYPNAELITYLPAQWKGQAPKDVTAARAKAKLTAEELTAVWLPSAKGLQHNVWDAVAIGLHHLGRFMRNQVIAR